MHVLLSASEEDRVTQFPPVAVPRKGHLSEGRHDREAAGSDAGPPVDTGWHSLAIGVAC